SVSPDNDLFPEYFLPLSRGGVRRVCRLATSTRPARKDFFRGPVSASIRFLIRGPLTGNSIRLDELIGSDIDLMLPQDIRGAILDALHRLIAYRARPRLDTSLASHINRFSLDT